MAFRFVLRNAQIPQGSIVGHVTDPAGGRVPNAEVTLENERTGVKRVTSTNQEGYRRLLGP
jgi:hypothetical protein